MTAETITFRDRFTKRPRTGRLVRKMDDGRLVVSVNHRAARGGAWVATSIIVKPTQVIGGQS